MTDGENGKKLLLYCPVCFYKLEKSFVYCPICGEATGQGDTDAEAEVMAREAERFIATGKYASALRLLDRLLEGSPVSSRYLTDRVRALSMNYSGIEAGEEAIGDAIKAVRESVPAEHAEKLPREYLDFEKAFKARQDAAEEKRVTEQKARQHSLRAKGFVLGKGQELINYDGTNEVVDIPEEVTSIAPSAFAGCKSLLRLRIHGGVQIICHSAFSGCEALEEVIFEKGIAEIGDRAFSDCKALKRLELPAGVRSVGKRAFSGCGSLTEVILAECLESLGEEAFDYCTALKSVSLPKGLAVIAKGCFRGCKALKEITLPESVRHIGEVAFGFCDLLERINIPRGVQEIGNCAFEGAGRMKKITVDPNNARFYMKDGCLIDGKEKRLVTAEESFTIPKDGSVTVIGESALSGKRFSALEIPEGVTEIARWGISTCTRLKELNLPESLKRIGGWAFLRCSALEGVVIPEGVDFIGREAFSHCSSLETAMVPSDCDIEENVFPQNCVQVKRGARWK